MKKQIIIYLILLIAIPVFAIKRIEANPINIAVMLMQERDTTTMASTCDYYGYKRQRSHEDFIVFSHPNGSILSYKLADTKYPIVEVIYKISTKERDHILKNLSFIRKGNYYERKSVGYITQCNNGNSHTLIFTIQSTSKNRTL